VAYIRKRGNKWRAEVQRLGAARVSKSFDTKAAATAWALREEAAIQAGNAGQWPRRTLSEAMERYEDTVSPTKRGAAFESKRFAHLKREYPALCAKVLHEITAADLAAWRDARLAQVAPASVLRDINLLRHVWTVAAREWLWCPEPSPWRSLRKPPDSLARTRRVGWRDVRRIVRWLGYRTGRAPSTTMEAVAWAFMISLRTAMRAGEVLSLYRGGLVDLERRTATLPTHKTMEREGARTVPLTRHAVRLLRHLGGQPLNVSSGSLDALFRRARDSLLIEDLHFHDARAEALTSLARRVDVMTLARISGHRDLRQLLQSYYRESAEQIAARL
jgi:integrase